jgi:hypothetical protein
MATAAPLPNLEGYKLLALSTGHLTAATAKLMTAAPQDVGVLVATFEEGFFVSAMRAPDPKHGDPEYLSLWTVCEFARKQGYQYLLLDRDADRIAELPDYDW